MTDWDLIKTQFQVLGKGPAELCELHDVSPAIMENAILGWNASGSGPDASDGVMVVGADNQDDYLEAIMAKHQSALMPKYIEIETTFLGRLKTLAGTFESADDAKKIADTLQLIKPNAMKQAGEGTGGSKVVIINKFDTPQPGDTDYVAPNSVILGEHARKNNGITEVRDFTTIEVEIPENLN